MKIRVLGCSGGIGYALRTTSILVDDDILIDAGTGVGDLTMSELLGIDHIFITHSHLDHIAFIPFLLDTVMGLRSKSVTVHGSKETLDTLRTHIFNWKVWPDFNSLPNPVKPFLKYHEIYLGETTELNGRKFTSLPANHIVPAMGYHVDSGQGSLVFTGDTSVCEALWIEVNQIQALKYLIIETAFSNCDAELAKLSKHLCPSMLVSELQKMNRSAEVYITHLKPGEGETIMQEILEANLELSIKPLKNHQLFTI